MQNCKSQIKKIKHANQSIEDDPQRLLFMLSAFSNGLISQDTFDHYLSRPSGMWVGKIGAAVQVHRNGQWLDGVTVACRAGGDSLIIETTQGERINATLREMSDGTLRLHRPSQVFRERCAESNGANDEVL